MAYKNNSKTLKFWLKILAIILPILVIILFSIILIISPRKKPFDGVVPDRSLLEIELYALWRSKVKVCKGSIWDFPSKSGKSAISLGVKCDLANPYHTMPGSKSLDVQLREKFKNDQEFNAILKKVEKKHIQDCSDNGKGYWVDVIPQKKINNHEIYLIAGIEAIPLGKNKEFPYITENKPNKIMNLVSLLCKKAEEGKISNLAIPLIGTGAGGVEEDVAFNAILTGINKAAICGNAPTHITLVLFPEGKSNDEKKSWFSERVRFLYAMINGKTKYNVWIFNFPLCVAIQLLLLIWAICLSSLYAISDPKLPVRIRTSVIFGNAFKWVLLSSGFIVISQPKFGFSEPLPKTKFIMVFLAALLMPLWEWYKLGETPDRKEQVPNQK